MDNSACYIEQVRGRTGTTQDIYERILHSSTAVGPLIRVFEFLLKLILYSKTVSSLGFKEAFGC